MPMRVFLWMALGMLVAACATLPPADKAQREQAWQAHQTGLARIQKWTLTGRLSLRAGQQGWRADMRWEQRGDDYDIMLNAPLGQGAAQLQGGHEGVTMQLADRSTLHSRSPEELLKEHYGWTLPLAGLKYWALGLAAPEQGLASELDDLGRLSRLEQAGWRISYQSYVRIQGLDLPEKILLEAPSLRALLIVDHWELNDG